MWIETLSRFSQAFYVLNSVAVLSWLVVRQYVDLTILSQEDYLGVSRETQIYSLLLLTLLLKLRRAGSADQFLSSAFTYSKISVVVATYYASGVVCAWYAVGFLVLTLTVHQQEYKGKTRVIPMRGADFIQQVEQDKSGNFWMIEFYTTWATPCSHFTSTFAAVSNQYGHDKLRFGKVDVGMWTALATKYDIDVNPYTTKELPVVMLFKNGKVHDDYRMPPKGANKIIMSEENVKRFFELDEARFKPSADDGKQAQATGKRDKGKRGKR